MSKKKAADPLTRLSKAEESEETDEESDEDSDEEESEDEIIAAANKLAASTAPAKEPVAKPVAKAVGKKSAKKESSSESDEESDESSSEDETKKSESKATPKKALPKKAPTKSVDFAKGTKKAESSESDEDDEESSEESSSSEEEEKKVVKTLKKPLKKMGAKKLAAKKPVVSVPVVLKAGSEGAGGIYMSTELLETLRKKKFLVKERPRGVSSDEKVEAPYSQGSKQLGPMDSGCATAFELPKVADNSIGWGPPAGADPAQFAGVPFAAFSRGDKIARISDFTNAARHQRVQRGFGTSFGGLPDTFSYKENLDENSFSLVDRGPKKKKYNKFTQRRQWNPRNNRAGGNWNRNRQKRRVWSDRNNRRGGGRWGNQMQTVRKDPSVKIDESWELVGEIDFSELPMNGSVVEGKDLAMCGNVKQYQSGFDRILPKSAKTLTSRPNVEYFTPTTSADPVLQGLKREEKGNVYATDTILGALMACTRSVHSWDVVITKKDGVIVLDKRPNSRLDYLTVNENWAESAQNAEGEINVPEQLAKEATYISRTYSQQCLEDGSEANLGQKNPFLKDLKPGHEAATEGYRYRQFVVADDLTLVVRTTVNAYLRKADGSKAFVGVRALNQFDAKMSGNVDWRKKLDTQAGSILATEMKNNYCKVTRWIAEMQIAGCEEFRLGFVSRKHPGNADQHVILGGKRYNTLVSFATAARVRFAGLWGCLEGILVRLQELPDGKFLMMRDPVEPKLSIYEVPEDAFANETGDPFAVDDTDN
eukprot:gb/GEZN01002483.1/.p1 GENE.gb/GEZN01002483.1/~~gb/GEZN01002483.1/.p1  ORF type:complete len:765 (+),score=153.20 gb/GEZN01002483.1/:43-2337(+)